ncbi:MAG: caspase domain-containing protein [Mesorhizobium sp.]
MTQRSLISAFAACALIFAALAQAFAQEPKTLNGVALIIGQSEYGAIAGLPNPANDAREMAKLLTDLGFDARTVTNRDATRLRRDLERFAEDAEGADVALIYYSGHGIEAGGENWLVPVDASDSSLEDAEEKLVPLSGIIDSLAASVPVTIVLLDACRTNPFPAGSVIRRSPGEDALAVGATGLGLVRGMKAFGAKPDAATNDNLGMVIGFAAEPGEPALDGEAGGNSPYAAALLRHLAAMKGVEFGQVLRMVTEEVYLATGTRQRPWTNESLRRLLYFGVAPAELEGVEGRITGERRQLLLTMADLPSAERIQVEQIAAREGVKLDALYGVLRAMGEEVIPKDPQQLDKLLETQAARLREMTAQRAALRTDDPQIASLSLAADRAIGEGAIVTAREFLDQAVARIEETAGAVDQLEAQLKDKRIADAAIYARRADASALTFAFADAAADYSKAFDLVEKWDDKLAWNYKNQEAEALRGHGDAYGDPAFFKKSLDAYQAVLNMVPNGEKNADWATTSNNMAVTLYDLGEIEHGSESLLKALALFEDVKQVFASLGDDEHFASAEHNIGGLLMELGERQGDPAMLRKGLEALKSALEKRPREKNPQAWKDTQGNIGIVEFHLAEGAGDGAGLLRAEAAYRAALEVATRDTDPIGWATLENNLGNTLTAIGLARNDATYHRAAVEAFDAAMQVRTRETWPYDWGASQLNRGVAMSNMSRHDTGTQSLEEARASFESALAVFDRARTPLDWASAQNNLGSALQTIGQRTQDVDMLRRSLAATEAAREVYDRATLPIDWAMTQMNAGNTLHLLALVTSDIAFEQSAISAYRLALEEYRRERAPLVWAQINLALGRALQTLAFNETETTSLEEAIVVTRQALEILSQDNGPVEWANAKTRLGTGLLNLSTRTAKPELLPEAKQAFEDAMTVFTKEADPVQWAFAQNSIGDVHWNLAAFGGGHAESEQAIARFDAAKEVFADLGQQPVVDLIDRKIALVKEQMK